MKIFSNYIELRNQIEHDNPPSDLPECFGEWWDVMDPEVPCGMCTKYKDHCFEWYREKNLAQTIEATKDQKKPITVELISAVAVISADSIQAMINAEARDGFPNTLKHKKILKKLATVEPIEKGVEMASAEAGDPDDKPKHKKAKKVSRKGRRVASRPQEAGSAYRAAEPAKTKKAEYADPVKGLDESQKKKFERELDRWGLKYAAPPGSTIQTTYKKKAIEATRAEDAGWWHKGALYPTLNAITRKYTMGAYQLQNGKTYKMQSWNGKTFWRIGKFLQATTAIANKLVDHYREDLE